MIQQQETELTAVQNYLQLRTFAYDVLKRVFLAEPTEEFIEQFQNGILEYFPFKEEDLQINEGINLMKEYFQSFDLKEDYHSIHWDYTRMFIGPERVKAPIWESAYLNKDGLLFQEETLVVRRLYLENNFISKQHRVEADDHLGLELDFMHQLSQISLDLMEGDHRKELTKMLENQKSFLTNHLLKWTPAFGKKVEKHANTDFFKGIVKVLNGFLKLDKMVLEELLSTLKK